MVMTSSLDHDHTPMITDRMRFCQFLRALCHLPRRASLQRLQGLEDHIPSLCIHMVHT